MMKATRQSREGVQVWGCDEDRALGRVCFASIREANGEGLSDSYLEKLGFFVSVLFS